jgi:hypothetical protein
MAQSTLIVSDRNGNAQQLEETVLATTGNLAPNVVLTDASGNRVLADAQGNLAVQNGGRSSALNLTAAAAIKASAGRLRKIVIIAPGSTSGAFTFNDCATTGAAAAGNTIFTMAYDATANVAGAVIELDWPCATGIVLSAVPGGGSPIVAVSYD